jgi:hypothetical protein
VGSGAANWKFAGLGEEGHRRRRGCGKVGIAQRFSRRRSRHLFSPTSLVAALGWRTAPDRSRETEREAGAAVTVAPGIRHVRLPWSHSPFPTVPFPIIWLTSWLFSIQKYSMISVFTSKGECPYIVKGRV